MEPHRIISLNDGWTIEGFDYDEGLGLGVYKPGYVPSNPIPAKVPGIVQNHLLEAGKIEDPYWEKNNEKILWIENKEWWYFRTLEIPENETDGRYELIFHGITYRAEVWLDGITIGRIQGTFKRNTIDITKYVVPGKTYNLTVRTRALERSSEDRPGGSVRRGMVRSSGVVPPFSYWWNWSPHLVPIGLWRDVSLKVSGGVALSDPHVRTSVFWNDCEEAESAQISVSVDVRSTLNKAALMKLRAKIGGKDFFCGGIFVQTDFEISPYGNKEIQFKMVISSPRLWWPNGMGEHPLYSLDLEIVDETGLVHDKAYTDFGVRELAIEKNADDEYVIETSGQLNRLWSYVGNPYPWTFVINKKKLFIRGSNWVPIDNLFRFTEERYRTFLDQVESSNLNMLRIWGGGIQETETFYKICDEKGLLCWAEFWFACSDYPVMPRKEFLENAEDMVRVLRNHPSLVMWSGGNEYNPDSPENKDLVDKLSELIDTHDRDRKFHRGSPYKGDRHGGLLMLPTRTSNKYGDILSGDQRKTLFRAEVAIARSTPVLESIKRFIGEDKIWPIAGNPEVKETWQYHHGVISEQEQAAREYGATGDLKHWLYASQIVHGLVHRHNLEYSRLTKWQSSGCMQWQVQASWPSMHREMIDWYGIPKPVLYFYKRASQDYLIALDLEKYVYDGNEAFQVGVFAVSDKHRYTGHVDLRVRYFSLDMELLHEENAAVELKENESVRGMTTDWKVPGSKLGSVVFISLEMSRRNVVLASNLYWIGISNYSRKDTCLNLSGPWKYQAAEAVDETAWQPCVLPGFWSKSKTAPSGGKRLFYRRRFEIPLDWEGCELEMFCQGFEGKDVVRFNGSKIGETEKEMNVEVKPDDLLYTEAFADTYKDEIKPANSDRKEKVEKSEDFGLLGDPIKVPNLIKRFYKIPVSLVKYGKMNLLEIELYGKRATGVSEHIFIREASTDEEKRAIISLDNEGAYLSALRNIPDADLTFEVFSKSGETGEDPFLLFHLENDSKYVSFLTVLKADCADDSIRCIYDDNYFAMLPGEERDIRVRLVAASGLTGRKKFICGIEGWNAIPKSLESPIVIDFRGKK